MVRISVRSMQFCVLLVRFQRSISWSVCETSLGDDVAGLHCGAADHGGAGPGGIERAQILR